MPRNANISPTVLYSWSRLPDLPDSIGVAGACAGVSGDALIIAGGAQFPVSLFEGGEKVWTDRVYVLQKEEGGVYSWHQEPTLEKPLGYAVSVTWGDEVICVGGGNAQEHFTDEPFAKFTSALDLGVGASSIQCDSARINLFDLCIAEVLLEWG